MDVSEAALLPEHFVKDIKRILELRVLSGTTTEDLWTPYKELVAVVEGYLVREGGEAPYAVHTFESLLRRHKQTFLSLLKYPPKNPTSRDEIKRGITEGVILPSIGRTMLSKELVDEAIIISDMYNVNEYLALELLHTAQRQAPRHPGLPRGLIAVVLLYDGRDALLQALRELVMARDGVSWSISARPEVIAYVSRYVDQLIADGLIGNTLDSLRTYSLATELELLQNNRAIPPRKHYRKLVNSIENTRRLMAGVIYTASAQRGLARDVLLRLLNEQSKGATRSPSGCLDDVSLALHMALLYALDLSVLHKRDDGEEEAKKLPLIQDANLISVLIEELSPPINPNQSALDAQEKASSGVRALCQLSLGLALAALKRAGGTICPTRDALLDQDEALVDAAIDGKVFEYIEEMILSNELSTKEEYYQLRLHMLITDFIVLMNSKLTEMRLKCEEASRAAAAFAAEGLYAGGAGGAGGGAGAGSLDAFLRCVERLYAHDPRRLRDHYYPSPRAHPHQQHHRWGGRSAALHKALRGWGAARRGGAAWRALAALCVARHSPALALHHHVLAALRRYRDNLRHDTLGAEGVRSMGASAVVASRPARLLVRQEEVEGMISGLKLIAAIAKVDQAACISICENLQWDALNVMFGLISCQVPIELKAELCLTLAALGSYSSSSGAVWAALEASQLVGPPGTMRGLSLELHETECRMEEYPLSLAFVSLLTSLCESGAGAAAGEPLVSHVLSRLTLPALHMRYRRPRDKWMLLSRCLNLLVLWLQNYDPLPSDIPERGQPNTAPAGLHLAIQLHNESELLRLLLSLLHDADQLQPAPSEEEEVRVTAEPYIQECVINALSLLELGLSLERSLSQAVADSGRSVPLIGLSKLILGNASSGRCHIVSWCLCVCTSVPRVVRRAASLLRVALTAPPAQRAAANAPAHLAQEIRHGFVECLETEDCAEDADSALMRDTKEDILDILLQVLPTAAPNFAHYLLGFQMTEQISRCQLNEAGAGGFPRTCLHSILDLLESHIDGAHYNNRETTELIEKCYKLLYHLVARPNTSGPVMRFLRSRDMFLMRHLQATVDLERGACVALWARSWLVRACACAAPGHARAHPALTHTEWQQCLLGRLGEAPVTVQAVPTPRWELFHADQLRKAIDDADLPTGMGGKRISVSRLHALLAREMASLQATAPQRNMLALEIQKVLDYVTEVNRQRDLAAALTHYFDSWRQLTEIIFCVSSQETLSLEDKKTLILNILQDLLNKITPAEVLPQIGYLASGTVLLLLVNLRHCYILQKRESSLKSTEFESTFFGPSNQIMQSKSLTLKFILNKILSWILQAGSTQKMRVNLYGALLNFLNIVNLKTSPAELDDEVNDTFVSRLDQSVGRPNKEESALKSMVIDVISSYGHNLSAIVCSDCIGGGHDVCRMVALSCLDTLVEIYPQSDWMNTLTNQGYLRSLIDSLLQDDEELIQTLEPQPKSLRVLYVYEARMSLLRKISAGRAGAEAALGGGALAALAGLRALDNHPDTHAPAHHHHAFLPSVPDRFRQLLVPCMSLCDALLTAVGSHNHSCVIHVTHLLLAHLECVDCVLRAAHPDSPKGLLIEVEAITSVIGRASNREVFGNAETETALDRSRAALQRVKALMLQLLPRFCVTLPNIDDLELELTMYKIISNILTYVRNITSPLSNRALLAPSIDVSFAEGEEVQLGSVVQMLCGAVRRCHAHDKLLATATHHQANLHSMTIEDMKKLLPSEPQSCSPVEVRAAAASHLAARVRARRSLARHCRYAAEASLYILWSNLHLYLRASVDTRDNAIGMTSMTALRGAYGEQLPELRKSLIAVFNDRFTEELLDIAKNQPASQRGFLEVLLKDIKSIIQFSPI